MLLVLFLLWKNVYFLFVIVSFSCFWIADKFLLIGSSVSRSLRPFDHFVSSFQQARLIFCIFALTHAISQRFAALACLLWSGITTSIVCHCATNIFILVRSIAESGMHTLDSQISWVRYFLYFSPTFSTLLYVLCMNFRNIEWPDSEKPKRTRYDFSLWNFGTAMQQQQTRNKINVWLIPNATTHLCVRRVYCMREYFSLCRRRRSQHSNSDRRWVSVCVRVSDEVVVWVYFYNSKKGFCFVDFFLEYDLLLVCAAAYSPLPGCLTVHSTAYILYTSFNFDS